MMIASFMIDRFYLKLDISKLIILALEEYRERRLLKCHLTLDNRSQVQENTIDPPNLSPRKREKIVPKKTSISMQN